MPKSVLLTEVSGFIAKHCALAFLTAGYSVRGTVRKLDRSSEVRATLAAHLIPLELSRLSFMQADLGRDAGRPEAMEGMDAVIHSASPFPIAQPRNPEDLIRPALGHMGRVSNIRAISALGMSFAPPEEAVLAAAAFVVAEGK